MWVWAGFQPLSWLTTWPRTMALEAWESCSRLSRTSVVARAGAAHQLPSRIAKETAFGIRFFITVVGERFTTLPFSLFRREHHKGAPLRSRRRNVQTAHEDRKLTRRVRHFNIARSERGRRAYGNIDGHTRCACAAARAGLTGGKGRRRGLSQRDAVLTSRYRISGPRHYSLSSHQNRRRLPLRYVSARSPRLAGQFSWTPGCGCARADGLDHQSGWILRRDGDVDTTGCGSGCYGDRSRPAAPPAPTSTPPSPTPTPATAATPPAKRPERQ